MYRLVPVICCLMLATLVAGFDFSRHSVPLDEIKSGGPGKDDIPAIDSPGSFRLPGADFLKDDDRVLA